MMRVTSLFVIVVILFSVTGCGKAKPKKKEEKKESIINKTTQDIGKYDPKAGLELQDSKIKATNPLTQGIDSYGPGMQKAAELGITHAVTLYYAEHGKYPTYEQFMSKIIKADKRHLPVLPYKAKYMYDEANHKLVVVKNPDAKEDEK